MTGNENFQGRGRRLGDSERSEDDRSVGGGHPNGLFGSALRTKRYVAWEIRGPWAMENRAGVRCGQAGVWILVVAMASGRWGKAQSAAR
jgi:hypothetical protein